MPQGATKPEVVFVTDQITLRAVKLAAHNALSYEIISDWPAFQSYCGTELGGQVVDVENNQLLNGDGLTGNMVGFYSTSGILTHDCATDVGPNETHLDSIEKSITALRVGPALATPDLLVLNPSDWSKLRRTKDLQARYLTQADPTVGEANSLWGIPVVVTTQNPVGKGSAGRLHEIRVRRHQGEHEHAGRLRERRPREKFAEDRGRGKARVVHRRARPQSSRSATSEYDHRHGRRAVPGLSQRHRLRAGWSTVEAPDELAEQWLGFGWVEKPQPKKARAGK